VSGTATGAEAEFETCIFGTASLVAHQAYNCSYTGTVTFSAAGQYRFINCQSGVPGSGAPTFALGTGDMNVEFRRWSGGINFTGIGLNDVITISGEMGTIDLGSATAGTVEVRGTYKAITNGSSGVTVNIAGAILGSDVAAILVDTGTTLQGELDAIQAAVITNAAGVDIAADIIALKAETALILDDTDLIDDATSGLAKIATDVAAILVDTGTTLDAALAVVDSNVDAILVDTSTTLDAALAVVDANVDAILVDTADIQPKIGTPAGASVSADVAAVKVDTAAILVDTGTTLDGRIPAALTAGGNMKVDALAVNGSTAGAANLALSTAGIIGGTAAAGTLTTTVMTTDLTGYVNDELIGRTVIWTGGTANGQASDITDYASAGGTVTYTAITTAPLANDTFVIV